MCFFNKEEGYSFIQFALVLPIVIIMLGLIFDMGSAIYAKMNIQHLAGDLHSAVSIYNEEMASGGIKEHSDYYSSDHLVKTIINNNKGLNKENISYSIDIGDVIERPFVSHIYNPETGYFSSEQNSNKFKNVKVVVEYKVDFSMAITKSILGDNIILKEKMEGPMFVGTDGMEDLDDGNKNR